MISRSESRLDADGDGLGGADGASACTTSWPRTCSTMFNAYQVQQMQAEQVKRDRVTRNPFAGHASRNTLHGRNSR